jgi:Alpha amylase, catalytic domain
MRPAKRKRPSSSQPVTLTSRRSRSSKATSFGSRTRSFYQLHVKAFADSNNDGMGDFAGLTEKLDYLEDLGVTALWLLPFYPSSGRDDGYDISDYLHINPDFGTMQDFRRFMQEARRKSCVDHRARHQPYLRSTSLVPARTPKPTHIQNVINKTVICSRVIVSRAENGS